MCGIFGFTGSPDRGLAAQMAALLQHRGPDASGVAEMPAATLGADRLAIVGVENGEQPLRNEAGDLVLVANGEIYNHLELRRRLERLGHAFATASDCEVVLHLYEELGEGFLDEIDGMYALALWDDTARRLLLVRDRFGMKPVYTATFGGRLFFASEIKAILVPTDMPRAVDPAALDAQLFFSHLPADRTMFAGVRPLPPGNVMRVEVDGNGDVTVESGRRYWQPLVRPARFDGDAPGTFLKLLDAAVASHLADEVPQAFTLSGGLDSSAVVALARRRLGRPIQTYAIGCSGVGDERPFARRVAEHCDTEHHEVEFEPGRLIRELPRVLWHLEHPLSGAMAITLVLFEEMARHARVALIGEGSDELLGGYDRFKSVLGPLAWAPGALGRRTYRIFGALARGRGRVYQPALLERIPRPGAGQEELAAVFARYGARRRDATLAYEQGVQLPGSQLLRVDRLSMACSLEARLPFLDRSLAQFVNRLPDHWKMRWRGEKRLLREAMRGLLPESIRLRPKYGLRTPRPVWSDGSAIAESRRILLDGTLAQRGYFRERYLRGLVDRVESGRSRAYDRAHLQQLVALELWHRLFIDPPRLAPPAAASAEVA